jgi:hypothetical protein
VILQEHPAEETADIAPPTPPTTSGGPVQMVMSRIIERVKQLCSPESVIVGFADAKTNLPLGPFVTDHGWSGALEVPRPDLVQRCIRQRQALVAAVTPEGGRPHEILCIPLLSERKCAFIYMTREPGGGASSGVLVDAMARLGPYADVLAGAAELPGRERGGGCGSNVAAHIHWYIGECKRSLFMMASGISQNNMAHVRAGHDNMKRLIHYFSSLGVTLDYIDGSASFEPDSCDLRQVARVTADAVTEMAAEHFIAVACRASETALPVMVNRRLLEAVLTGLLTYAVMNAREGDEIRIEAISPDGGETAWFSLLLPAETAGPGAELEKEIAFVALKRLAGDWFGAIECAPDEERYIIRISFPCAKGKSGTK